MPAPSTGLPLVRLRSTRSATHRRLPRRIPRRSGLRDRLPVAGAAVDSAVVVGHVESFLDAHLNDPDLELDRLADAADVSISTLGRAFREEKDTTPWRYVMEQRIRAARRLLATTDRSLAAVALDTGFFDQPHFTRTFRRLTGRTPGAYRDAFHSSDGLALSPTNSRFADDGPQSEVSADRT